MGGLKPSRGDTLCIIYGHLARLAIWRLRPAWDKGRPVLAKLAIVAKEIERCGTVDLIAGILAEEALPAPFRNDLFVHENDTIYGGPCDEISF